ncbi:Ferredoxin [Caminicella sporogenes DSM 14501]|uniref:Ferredoxin n=1 Tax=Caminicella sporogenes DSM 14501 TaxID=1121266 RepID=A0A1M6SLA1_9FIRM|nr:permease [Caminicella sporogenes]RKD26531.1 permease [Caminicella sporogenes]SHK45485.1 Ferredoxin [Caminicella sporogenes DSM 14501]
MILTEKIKKNKMLFSVSLVYIILLIVNRQKAVESFNNSMYYVIEMFQIMPVVFILTSLIEAWVPKKVIIDNLGEKSGYKGKLFSFIVGSLSAGPIYAAFPICKTLIRKGASISNVVIILSAWAVVKVPMLVNEAKFLGVEFMILRWILTIISILIMAYMVSVFVKRDSIPKLEQYENLEEEDMRVNINRDYCIGCGICEKLSPDNFMIENGKAVVIDGEINDRNRESVKNAVEKCPVNAITL